MHRLSGNHYNPPEGRLLAEPWTLEESHTKVGAIACAFACCAHPYHASVKAIRIGGREGNPTSPSISPPSLRSLPLPLPLQDLPASSLPDFQAVPFLFASPAALLNLCPSVILPRDLIALYLPCIYRRQWWCGLCWSPCPWWPVSPLQTRRPWFPTAHSAC